MIIPNLKKQVLLALKKASGTVQKASSMVEEEKYCLEIIQMISAAEGLLRGAKLKMLENHLQTCGHEKMASPKAENRTEFAKELVRVLDISSRT